MGESKFLLELQFIFSLALTKFMNFLYVETVSSLTIFSSDPLFSCIVTFCTLILLYFPHRFLEIVFSPVLILTGILLLTILRLGATQRSQNENKENSGKSESIFNAENREITEEGKQSPSEPEETISLEHVDQGITSNSGKEINSKTMFGSSSCFGESFLQWNVRAPLEVIYEEYEGEEGEENPNEKEDTRNVGIVRYPSLSRYYPESDSDSSSDGGFSPIWNRDSPENICFGWDEEDKEGLIEIALDGGKKRALESQFEEENLIEIDISPTRYGEFPGEADHFSGEISCNPCYIS